MTKEISLETTLDKFRSTEEDAWIVLYKDRQLIMPSGKRAWGKRGHAKNALIKGLETFYYSLSTPILEEVNKLIANGTIQIKNLK